MTITGEPFLELDDVVNLDDARMPHRTHGARLPEEALDGARVLVHALLQELERDRLSRHRVNGPPVTTSHAAFAEAPLETEATRDRHSPRASLRPTLEIRARR